MDSAAKLLLTEAVPLPATLKEPDKIAGASEEKKMQAAKDFESVLIAKLLDAMKNTIGDWGLEKDAVSKQVGGIFWLYLARGIANNGGFGMWKDMYQFLNSSGQADTKVEATG